MSLPPPLTDREATILSAAFHAFSTYGYRRTAMDDIATGAGLSRTALYLHYRNKEEIFRALVQATFDQALTDMQLALAQPDQTLEDALMACFIARDGRFMEVILTTPHGAEVLDEASPVSGDLAAAGEGHIAAVLAEWLDMQGLPEGLGPATALADTILSSLKGLRSTSVSIDALREAERRLAILIARALA